MEHDESTAACAAADVAARLVFERKRARAELRAVELELELLRQPTDQGKSRTATALHRVDLDRAAHRIAHHGGRHGIRA